jgi:hypothetical protein
MPTPNRKLLHEAAASEARRLASDPNVACVGFGLKFVGGKPTPVAALHYHVRAKLATAAEIRDAGSQPILAEHEGYTTDVHPWTIGRMTACPTQHPPTGDRGSRKEDPLVGGTSTSVLSDFHSIRTSYGTLGGVCFDVATGAAMALSNAHVYGLETGKDVIQPWVPTSDYVWGSVKWLFCGGPLSNVFFWTAPTPATDILAAAAAAAWIAAAASDAEDPNRWGQRTGTVPIPGVKTQRERIRIEAKVPRLPFPGRHWTAEARWDYTRETTAGQSQTAESAGRQNEHVLVGKRVFTSQEIYTAGETVRICAQVWTPAGGKVPPERFVVAHSFPLADPSRMIRRVLVPGVVCERIDIANESHRQPICLHGFNPQVPGVTMMNLPILAAPFVFIGSGSTTLLKAGAPGNPSGVTALRLPEQALPIACPPSTHVELKLFHRQGSIRAMAISANNKVADQAATPAAAGVLHTLKLTGPEIVRVVLESGGNEAYLAEICVDKHRLDLSRDKAISTYYTGAFPLPASEPDGKWAVAVVTQSLDPTPTGGDPLDFARRLSGIVDSANVIETGECVCELLFDATFAVGPVVVT